MGWWTEGRLGQSCATNCPASTCTTPTAGWGWEATRLHKCIWIRIHVYMLYKYTPIKKSNIFMNTKYLIAGRRYAQFGQLTEKPHNCINIQIYKCMQFILFHTHSWIKFDEIHNCRPSTSRAAGWEAPQLQTHIASRRCTWHTQCVWHITAHYDMHLSDSWLRIHTIEYIIYAFVWILSQLCMLCI